MNLPIRFGSPATFSPSVPDAPERNGTPWSKNVLCLARLMRARCFYHCDGQTREMHSVRPLPLTFRRQFADQKELALATRVDLGTGLGDF